MLQVLTIRVCDSHLTGRPDVGYVKFPLTRMPQDGCLTSWLPVQVCSSISEHPEQWACISYARKPLCLLACGTCADSSCQHWTF